MPCAQRWQCGSVSTKRVREKNRTYQDCPGHFITNQTELVRHCLQKHTLKEEHNKDTIWRCPFLLCKWSLRRHNHEICPRSEQDHAFLCNNSASIMHLQKHLGYVNNGPWSREHEHHKEKGRLFLNCLYCHMQRFNFERAEYFKKYDEAFTLRMKMSKELYCTQIDYLGGRGLKGQNISKSTMRPLL